MSRLRRAAILCLLFLAPLLAGCQGPTTITTTTTAPPEPTPVGFIEFRAAPEFTISSFVALPSEHGRRVVAYGYPLPNVPFVGIYDAEKGQWTSIQLSAVPSTFLTVHGAEAPDGTITVAVGLGQYPNGIAFTNAATFDGKSWQVEDMPTRWLRLESRGVAAIEGRTYVLVGARALERTVQLWHTDDHGGSWQLDPPLVGVPAWAWLSGNATHLHVCAMDDASNIVFLARKPADLSFTSEVVWEAPGPIISGGFDCRLSAPTNGPPMLAWSELVLALQERTVDEVLVAWKAEGGWRFEQVGEESGRPVQILAAGNGTLLYTRGPGPANLEGERLWRFQEGVWSLCPAGLHTRVGGAPQTLVKWAGQVATAGTFHPAPPTGNATIQPLDPTTPDCLARTTP